MEQLPVPQRSVPDVPSTALEAGVARRLPIRSRNTEYLEIDSPDVSGDDLGRWLEYWHLLTRRKLLLGSATFLGMLAAFVVSLFQTPLYVTSTTLEFTQAGERQPFDEISFLNAGDPYLLQTQAQRLRSGTLQARVSAKLSSSPPQDGITAHDPLRTAREWLGLSSPTGPSAWRTAIGRAGVGLRVTPVKETRIVQIFVESTLPRAAADYANTLTQEFIQENLEERWSLYQATGAWLERAQDELKAKLEESERQLIAYSSAAGLIVTSETDNIAEQRLVELQSELSKAQADRISKEAVYRTAVTHPAESLGELLAGGLMGSYEMKLADLRRELAEATTALTQAHPKVKRLQAQIEELKLAQSREQGNILNRMRTEYESARHRETQLLANFDEQSKVLADQDQKLIRYKMLQREVETYRKLYETTLQKGKEASVASALRPVGARVVDPAYSPRVPSKPNLVRNLSIGPMVGLVLAVAFVLFRERTDASIRAPGSIPLAVNLRELGVIPAASSDPGLSIAAGRRARWSLPSGGSVRTADGSVTDAAPVELTTWNRKGSLLAESVRATLTSILMSGQRDGDKRVILVTSPSPREGKSTVVTNLGIALAEIHQRVLVIDADLRRPRVHTIFGQANTWGLSDLLRENTPCAEYAVEALARQTHVPGLFSLPSGPGNVEVSRLLHSVRMRDLLNRLRGEFDAILIDTPPVLSVADARILSRLADAVVLVVRAGQTTREAAAQAVNAFEGDGIPVLGTVLNDWNPSTMGGGYYPSYYQQHYAYYHDASND
jgi:succinoglycan biosynthesis transport protein ExoP